MSGPFNRRNLAMAGATGLAAYFVIPRTSASKLNPMVTPGVKQIEDRWSSGGGTTKHTPGVATPRGNSKLNEPDQIKGRGLPTEHYKNNVSDQKPWPEYPNKMTEKWWETHYGRSDGR
ncbi:hypothetical protein KVT40_008052 [Elsinoe batatas]|uniref:Uncharacterized protein n=1 Tax=Elsinoe batatas TaxID=2601811 RepID=A0A8K0KW43_9PEZI|nr:hypothetical protein KVT40_008052 [Elsinoe batatas]